MKTPPRLTRKLVDKLPENIPDPGPIPLEVGWRDEDYNERTARDVLARLPEDGELWVFAFGSLIWNPRCCVVERRKAWVSGWQRSFCLGPDTRYRGNPDAPGLMLSLEPGESCEALVLRVDPAAHLEELTGLLGMEPPMPPVWVEAQTSDGPVSAIAFACLPDSRGYDGGYSVEQVAERLSKAVGMFGSMPDYLLKTVEHLQEAGIHDPYLWDMQERVAALLEEH